MSIEVYEDNSNKPDIKYISKQFFYICSGSKIIAIFTNKVDALTYAAYLRFIENLKEHNSLGDEHFRNFHRQLMEVLNKIKILPFPKNIQEDTQKNGENEENGGYGEYGLQHKPESLNPTDLK